MANTKEYTIKINGLQESINAVDSLNKQLDKLEQRMKTINATKTSSGGGSSSSRANTALSEEERVQKEINKLKEQGAQLDAKIAASQDEIYKRVDATKQLYKETIADQKAIAAQERLTANAYSNTMVGMKQQLADIKAVIQTTDLSDNDGIKKMTEQANELTKKLKEMEEAYGQFGRNVGNYQSAVEGLNKLKIEVGGTVREFNSAKEASKTFKNELYALELQGKSDTKEADNLRQALYRLQSAMDDATKSSRAMDEAMDFMQSFTAMASVGNGLQAFFGFDDNEITKSIQKLVALQGVLNGLETLRKQMETREGIGKVLGKGFENIDKWTYSLRRMNVQLRGTGTSARIAAAGIKVLNFALKGLMTLGIGIAIDLLVEGLQKAAKAVQDFVRGDADLITSSEVMENTIEAQNRVLEKNLELIKKRHDAGDITTEQARVLTEKEYARALQETTKNLVLMADVLERMGALSKNTGLQSVIGDKGVTWIGGFSKAIESIDDFIERWDYLERAVAHGGGLESWLSTASDARDEFVHLNALIGEDFMAAMKKFSDGTAEGTRKLIEYIDQMDKLTGGRYSKAMNIVKVDNEGLQKDLENAWAMIQTLRDNVFKNPVVVKIELDSKIEQELDRLDPTRAAQRTVNEWKELLRKGVDEAGNVLTESQKRNIEKIIKEQEKNIAKQKKQRLDSERNAAKKLAEEAERVEKEINKLRIENMKEGLAKTLAQLAEERRERLEQARITGIRVGELTLEINKLYDKKELEAKKEHAKEVQQVYADMWEQIYRSYDQTFRMNSDTDLQNLETQLQKLKQATSDIFTSRYMSYGGVRLPYNMSDELRRSLGHDINANSQGSFDEGTIRIAKEYLDILQKIDEAEISIEFFGDDEGTFHENWVNAKKELDDWLAANETTAKEMDELWAVQELKQQGYTKTLSQAYKVRIRQAASYYQQIEDLEISHSEKVMNNELELLKNETNTAKREELGRFNDQMARLEENYEKGLVIDEKYAEIKERAYLEHANALEAIEKRYASESERIEQEHQERKKQIIASGAQGMLNEYRDAYNAISNLQSRQPQTFGGALDGLGIINIGATRKNYKEALDAFKELSNNLIQQKEYLMSKALNEEDREQIKREFDGLIQDVADAASEISQRLKSTFSEAMGVIAQLASQIGLQLNSMLQTFADYVDQQHENAINELEDQIDKQKELQQKQEELANEHKNKLNEIEDELATARGDRRQRLIDELNAEMAAQRKALQEQQKAEKEQKRLEQQKDREEKKRKEDQKKMAMTQAVINGATAFMNALSQQPIWLGIALAAMTAVMTAAQIATISSAKYADGGVIQGKSHAQGGVKVLGGAAEVEGGEYITNKRTTAQNIDLLEYINSRKKKIDLSDLVEFYSSGKTIKNISPTKRIFADGGQIPTLRGDIDINSRLLTAFEDYSNRPVQVAVVDINERQAAVKNVQVMAGLEQ